MKILSADDDPQILSALRIILGAHGYTVIVARDGNAALDAVIRERPDLVLLDLGMPGLSGLQVVRAVRGFSTVPIVVVSGRTDSADKVAALDLGADDYVTKPFLADELAARIPALTRRATNTEAETPLIAFGDVTVDLVARSVRVDRDGSTRDVRLTKTEWAILELLLRNPNRLVTQRTILEQVWGPGHDNDTGYLRLYIGQLRKKLEAEPSSPRHFITDPGMGYRFVENR